MHQHQYTQVKQILEATHIDLRISVAQLMPASAAGQFWRWALEPDTSQCAEWLQVMGIRQLAILTVGLLDGLLTPADWERITPAAAHLNTYLTYEVVSDNLAIGCATPGFPTTDVQRAVLQAFNTAIVAQITGAPTAERDQIALAAATERASISLVDQSLTAPDLRALITTFASENPTSASAEVEYDLLPILKANIAACLRAANMVTEEPFQTLVQTGLRARYVGVNRLIAGTDQRWEQRLVTGQETILVHPVLAYYAALLQERTPGDPPDGAALDTLFQHAAMLVRLLNDIGSALLEMPAQERAIRLDQLRQHSQTTNAPTLLAALQTAPDGAIWTRLIKDLRYGEWNIAIPDQGRTGSLAEQIAGLEEHLQQAATIYATHHHAFATLQARLQQTAHSTRIAILAERFVHFHQILYRHAFTSTAGEYAAGSDARGVGV